MNSAYLLPDAHENEKLVSVGGAAAWYWACGLMYCRRKQQDREARGERVDLIPEAVALTLFADPKARDHVKALVRVKLWHIVEGVGYAVNDYSEIYDSLIQPESSRQSAEVQPDTPDNPAYTPAGSPADSKPKSSQMGGAARSESSRNPAGTFVGIQPASGVVSPTPPSSSEREQKQGSERLSETDLPENEGSGRARAGRAKRPKTPMPAGFCVTTEHLEHAAKKGWPEWWVRNRFEQFEQLAKRDDWKYSSWNQAFYVFLGNEISYRRGPKELAHLAPGASPQPAGFRPRGPVQNNHGQTGFEAVTGGAK